jgi:hypothetical protein
MQELSRVAPAFVEMAHRIVWCTAATVDRENRPRSRVLHPLWEWDGLSLVGWICTVPSPVKRADLAHSPFMSCNYLAPNHDTCSADCRAAWRNDDETRREVWELFKTAPEPVGYDPAIVPMWADGPLSGQLAILRLDPYRLRVFPGTVLLGQGGEVLNWREGSVS